MVDDAINGDMMDNQRTDHIEVHNRINTMTSSVLETICQPPGECDPESDLPCSCPLVWLGWGPMLHIVIEHGWAELRRLLNGGGV